MRNSDPRNQVDRRRIRGVLLLLLLLLPVFLLSAQTYIKNFRVPEYDEEGRLKSRVEGDSAVQVSRNKVEIEGLTVETFNPRLEKEFGIKSFTVRSTKSTFDAAERVIESTESVLGTSADGTIQLSGVGFRFDQKANKLVISNEVQTVINKEFLKRTQKNKK